jgi:RND family efflux transporter MFP subunit
MSRTQIRWLVAALVLLLVIGLAWTWLTRSQPSAEPPAQPAQRGGVATVWPVVVAAVDAGEDQTLLDVIGSARAARSATLFAAVPGEVERVNFRAGQAVRAGEVLVQLVDRPQRLSVELAAARLEQSRRLLARYEATRGTGAVPGSVIDEAESAVRVAEIELAQAREALADRVLRAPFSGVIGLPGAEPGERVASDTLLATIDDRRTLQVEFSVPELFLPRMTAGLALSVSNPGLPGRQFGGRVTHIDSRVDAGTRTVRLRADVPNEDDALRPGMSLQVRLALQGGTRLRVPELALQWDREGAHVWVVRDERVTRVAVEPLRRVEGRVFIEGALQAGDWVVVEGLHNLREGRRIRVIGRQGGSEAQPGPDDVAARGAR